MMSSTNNSSTNFKETLLNGHRNQNISENAELIQALNLMLRELFKILPIHHQKKGFFSKKAQSTISAQILSDCIVKVMGNSELVEYIGKLMVKVKMIEIDGDSDSLLKDKKKTVRFLHPYLPRLVIVGGGHAGLTTALQLHEYFSIVLIDKNDYISLKPGYPIIFETVENANKISVKYSECLPSDVSFVRGLAKVVRQNGVYIDPIGTTSQTYLFSANNEQSNELKNCQYLTFDYLVVCTGCNSWRNIPNYDGTGGDNKILYSDSYDMDMLKAAVNTIGQMDDSKAVVLIGGGIVGAEFFGALALGFPKKKIYMIQRSDMLMKPNQDAHKIAMETFGKMKNGTIMLSSQVDRQSDSETLVVKSLESGTETSIKTGVCILASGTSPNTSMMKDSFASSLDESGYVKVNSSFQLFKSNSEYYRNIFVLGDINNLDAFKLMQNANFHAEKFAEIIKMLAQQENKELPIYKADARVMGVSLGPKYGFVMKEEKVMFKSSLVIKLKNFLYSSTMKAYNKQASK